ncbi:hypothetical protein [Luteibacter sp. RCC_6_2]|jgi:RecJ-like exonuclease|uniref:hypothetical protein n=1 Tax=Luteibacter sp. RCC_6_2 TaxID=3239223 RepID=UPI003523DBBC
MPTTSESTVCAICQGTGTVTYVDEEVGCQVEVPCWACTERDETALAQHSPNVPWIG